MKGLQFTKHAPKPVCQWLSSAALSFAIDETLYDVSAESDRRIKFRKISATASLAGLTHWGIAKLATSETFSAEHWQTLVEVTRISPDDDTEFYLFFAAALIAAVGQSMPDVQSRRRWRVQSQVPKH
jgi:hypothetical protein